MHARKHTQACASMRKHARAFAILIKIVTVPSRAPSMSDGAQFNTEEGFKWEEQFTNDNGWTRRITECPAGFALRREQSNPQSDACIECPGTSDYGYSLQTARWTGNQSETGLGFFCKSCPSPASSVVCQGGTEVYTKQGWYLMQENASEDATSRRNPASKQLIFKAYQCDLEACDESNGCYSNRTGIACGRCPEHWVLEGSVCQNCSNYYSTDTKKLLVWRIVFGVGGGLLFSILIFLLAWAPVFGGTTKEYFKRYFAWPVRVFNRMRTLRDKVTSLNEKTDEVRDFLGDPENLKLLQQYIKILIAYLQIIGGFVVWKVPWPHLLQSCIGFVYKISNLIRINLLEIPGLPCLWSSYGFKTKFYVKMATPAVVSLSLALPVAVAWVKKRRSMKWKQQRRMLNQDEEMAGPDCCAGADSELAPGLHWKEITKPQTGTEIKNAALARALQRKVQFSQQDLDKFNVGELSYDSYIKVEDKYFEPADINWTYRYENTVDAFWNNIMFWLFLIYPGTSLSSVEPFICRKIANQTYLIADYREECPLQGYPEEIDMLSSSSLAWVALFCSIVYPIGVPLLMYGIMRFQDVPKLVRKKIGNGLVTSMISDYVKATTTPSSIRLASFLGMPPGMKMSGTGREKQHADGDLTEFERRQADLFSEIFPQHEKCGESCAGHRLPEISRKLLGALAYPTDLADLIEKTRVWFERIDADKSGGIDEEELSIEFQRIGISLDEAGHIMKFHRSDGDTVLGVEEFVDTIVHILGNCVHNFAASDIVALAHQFHKLDRSGDGTLDLEGFSRISLELASQHFIFNGPENLNTLNITQLNALRQHKWKRRKAQELDEGEEPDNAQDAMDDKAAIFDAEPQEDEETEPKGEEHERIYRITISQKRVFSTVCSMIVSSCLKLFRADATFCKRTADLHDDESGDVSDDLVPFIVELKARIQAVLDQTTLSTDAVPLKKKWSLKRGAAMLSAKSIRTKRALEDHYAMLIQIEKGENLIKSILLEHVLEIAFKLRKEGLIEVPALEWDGSLGSEEERIINRIGFLLNAYSVQAWWWEIVEMVRKLILTTLLAVAYKGEPPQLAGSMVTIFVFLLGHLLLRPYLNQGLNVFQRLALLSQLATVFGAIMFVLTDCHEKEKGLSQDSNGRTIMAGLIFLLNASAIGLYPTYKFFDAWAESGEIDFEFVKNTMKHCWSSFIDTPLARHILDNCACLMKAKEKADELEETAERLKRTAQEYADQWQESQIGSAAMYLYQQGEDVRTLQEHVTDLTDCADEVKTAALDARNEVVTGHMSGKKEEVDEITEEGVSLQDQSWQPRCPTGGHAMVLSMGSYTCNLCGMHFDPTSKHLRQDRGRRWSCAACGDDFCFDCRPLRGSVEPAQHRVDASLNAARPTELSSVVANLAFDNRSRFRAAQMDSFSPQRSDGHTFEEDHNGKIQEVGGAPVDGDRAARKAVSRQHLGGFCPAGYVARAHLDPDARPTPPPRASDQAPIVFESIHGLSMSSNVIFGRVSPRLQYANEARQDETVSRGETDDSPVVGIFKVVD